MLDEPALREAKVSFWERHKLRNPARIMLADSLQEATLCLQHMDRQKLDVPGDHQEA